MKTLILVKRLLALGIVIAMFIPIAQCSYEPSKLNIDNGIDKVVSEKALENPKKVTKISVVTLMDWSDPTLYWLPLLFVLPVFFCFPRSRNKRKALAYLVLQIAVTLTLITAVINLVFIYHDPLPAGYVLCAITILFLFVGFMELNQLKKSG